MRILQHFEGEVGGDFATFGDLVLMLPNSKTIGNKQRRGVIMLSQGLANISFLQVVIYKEGVAH